MFRDMFRGQPPLKRQLAWAAIGLVAVIVISTIANRAGLAEKTTYHLVLLTTISWAITAGVFLRR